MEFIRGGTLEQLMDEKGCLDMDRINDLKPPNILLNFEGHIKIADFVLVAEGMFSNNKIYEIARTSEIHLMRGYGAEVDWWAFAIILFEMATGRAPFNEDLPLTYFRSVIFQQPSIPEDISAI
ncbi:RAC family serine/threonine-protein kinase homolog [Xenopus laevis]|nr:RAC family serine/threonine-protein kinase homolog [Xenopus laevis]